MTSINGEKIISIKEIKKPLKVAHFASVKPNQAGISGTAIDMVSAERAVGIDAQLIDYAGDGKPCIVGIENNGVSTIGPSWAKTADIIVRHSAIPPYIQALNIPQVMCLHGRPEYGFMLHYYGKSQLLGEYFQCAKDPKYRAFVTFWKEHLTYLNILMPDVKIDYIPAMVNLDVCKPDGVRLDYGTDGGKPNILIADMWREDTTPFNILIATAKFVLKYCPEARVHICGLQKQNESPVKDVIEKMKAAGVISQSETIVKNMNQIYRGNDILVTPHHIATRIIREALAYGLPIVAGMGCPYTKFTADARHTAGFAAEINRCWNSIKGDRAKARKDARAMAEKNFNLKDAGKAALKVFERIMKEPKPVIELRTKPMIYNFIAYAQGDKENLGKTYNEYMELVGEKDWACFLDHDAMFTTGDWFKQLEKIIVANPQYDLLTACTNRIGNPEQKLQKLLDTHDITYHRGIGARLQKQCGTDVNDVTVTHAISGVVMLVSKAAWKKAGGFKDGFLGLDNDFHQRVKKADFKVGVMKGIYVYHWYRADGKGLKPIETKPAAVAG